MKTKPWWKSKTLWGFVLGNLPSALNLIGNITHNNLSDPNLTSICLGASSLLLGKAIQEKPNLNWSIKK